jgi:hypothetical protein
MENINFSEKNIENNDEEQVLEKTTKIIFDYNQLDYIKFRLTFSDGFMFGLGIISSFIIVSIILFIVFTILGISFSNFLLKELM